jgi:hypothetical protein
MIFEDTAISTPPAATPVLPRAQGVALHPLTAPVVADKRLTIIPPSPNAKPGLRSGLYWRDNRPADFTRVCGTCGREFTPKARSVERGVGFYCSRSCAARTPRPNAPHHCPESTKAQRVRANGLVNKRRKLGWFTPPANCQKCGAAKRLDSHHPDYSKPDEVLWLCRGCHRRAHTDPASVAGLSPVKLDKPAAPIASAALAEGGRR